jgi:hypothetical protein
MLRSCPPSLLRQKSQRRHPFSVLLESIKDTIVWDSSLRFSARTFIRYDDQDHAGSQCNWPAKNRKKAKVVDLGLITED